MAVNVATKKRGRPKKALQKCLNARVVFSVTPEEKARLIQWAREDGCSTKKFARWLREQVGLHGGER